MEGPNAASQPGPAFQDSVVGGNLHTGNVIHNHYHITQSPTPPPQSQVAQQPVAPPQTQPLPSQRTAVYVNANPNLNVLGTEERNLVVAYILWLFLGIIGGHRFYLGHYVLGIAYFFTWGFLGIGWLIDAFLLPDLVYQRNHRAPPR
jgi:hypothetical protein